MGKLKKKIDALKEKVFLQNDTHCFIERERFLNSAPNPDEKPMEFYANTLSDLLDNVSTPIDCDDIFVGRVIEGPIEEGLVAPSQLISSNGHFTPDYERLLKKGYKGILDEINENAKGLGSDSAFEYAKNAETVINAIRRFASRYAEEAKKCGKEKAYEALSRVPFEPAYDLYSALSGIWIVHMISSCYAGARDYGFGYMDEYLYPYYLQEKAKGVTDDEIGELLAGFFVKTNEICGRCTHNYKIKPILCQASKQYVILDGGRANELSEIILSAAKINNMAQPSFTVILSEKSSDSFKDRVFDTMAYVTDKMQVYNYELVYNFLKGKGLPEEIATRPSYSACCTFDLSYHSIREEFYLPTVMTFCDVLYGSEFSTKEDFLEAFKNAVTRDSSRLIQESRVSNTGWWNPSTFIMDALLIGTCNERCEYPPKGISYRAKNVFLPGIATLSDSLCALDEMVFKKKAFTYSEFIAMLKANFEGYEAERSELLAIEKFGNDGKNDKYATEMANVLIDAVEALEILPDELLLPSFYSLIRDNSWAQYTPATPDGRLDKTPFSENQSPSYGADKNGITALLNSLSKIPFYRTPAGGLNLTFSSSVKPDILHALVKTYFESGGLHVGITVLDKDTLRDAMKNPDKYKSLTVRLYGFSEYFISLPEWQQIAVLNRTAY